MQSAFRAKTLDDLDKLVEASKKPVRPNNSDPHVRLILDGDKVVGFGPSPFESKNREDR